MPVRVGAIALGAALWLSACGDDERSQTRSGEAGAGGDASAGGPSSSGSSALGGEGGSATSSAAGSSEAGQAGAGGSVNEGIDIDQFCELQGRARQWLRECRPFFGDASLWWGTQNIDLFCSAGREAIEAGRLIYDPVKAQACAMLSVGDCNAIEAFAFGLGQQGGDCAGVVTGAVPLGDECHASSTTYAAECAEGFCSGAACPGVCGEFAGEGDDCDGISALCDPAEAFCNAQNKCELLIETGEACPGPNTCVLGDVCQVDDAGEGNTCVTPILLGQACEMTDDLCADQGVCYEQKCVAQVPVGEVCAYASNCPAGSYCNGTCQVLVPVNGDCTSANCVADATCVEGVCVAQGQPGDACPCATGLWCDGEDECQAPGGVDDPCLPTHPGTCRLPLFCHPQSLTCVQPAAENETCNVAVALDSCAQGLHCVCTSGCVMPSQAQGTCQPRLADGEDCGGPNGCLSGFCTNLKCVPDPACR